jgi:hypothetical protein
MRESLKVDESVNDELDKFIESLYFKPTKKSLVEMFILEGINNHKDKDA